MFLASLVLLALVLSLGAAVVRPAAPTACLLLVLSALWLPANSKLEGPTLIVLSPTHAVTAADMLTLVGTLVGTAVLIGVAWRRSRPADRLWNVVTVLGGCWSVLALGALLTVGKG